MDLEEWTIQYVKHRDIIHKKLEGFEKEKDLIIFNFKDKKHYFFITHELEENFVESVEKHEWATIVCAYNKKNMDFVVKKWSRLIKNKNFWIIFAEPDSGKKLLLNPFSHNSIADPETLEQGLRSMFEAGLE